MSTTPFEPSQLRTGVIGREHVDQEICPACEQPIPNERAAEVRERQRRAEEAQRAQLRAEFEGEVERAVSAERAAHAQALAKLRETEEERLDAARQEARQAAEAESAEKLKSMQRANTEESDQLRARLEESDSERRKLANERDALNAQMADARRVTAEREAAFRREIEAALAERIEAAEQAQTDAESKFIAAAQRLEMLENDQAAQLAERLKEQRDALEKAKVDAVNAEKAAAFQDKLKLHALLDEAQRKLDKKTAEELGEGAELDLFEQLKAAFPDDILEHIGRSPGADIRHVVRYNGNVCGKIVYDSKNRNKWELEYATKLASDKLAEQAEHAILATRRFPKDESHLAHREGVILASPARILAVAKLLRDQLIQMHALRLSREERIKKTAALYDLITSPRAADVFARHDQQMESILEIDVKEDKARTKFREERGKLVRSAQKLVSDFRYDIETIIGFEGAKVENND